MEKISNNHKKKIIYLFDSSNSLKSLHHITHLSIREENNIYTIAILDKSISGGDHWKKYFDSYHIVSTIDDQKDPCPMSFSEVTESIKKENIDSLNTIIVPYGEYTSILAAQLREEFGIKGHKISDATPFRDKIKMKGFAEKSVKVPSYTSFDKEKYLKYRATYFDSSTFKIPFPFVIKPVNAASALATKVINSVADIHLIDEALQEFSGDFELEEFIEGQMFTCEVLFKNGEPIFALSSQFNRPVLDISKGYNIGSIPLLPSNPMFNRLRNFCVAALSESEIKNGITHSEIFINTKNELVFLETACRVPGGKLVEAYIDSFGINILNIDQRLKINLPISNLSIKTKQYAFWAVIPNSKGKIERFISPNFQSKFDINWNYQEGDTTRIGKNFVEILAIIYVYNNNYITLMDDFKKVSVMKFANYINNTPIHGKQ